MFAFPSVGAWERGSFYKAFGELSRGFLDHDVISSQIVQEYDLHIIHHIKAK